MSTKKFLELFTYDSKTNVICNSSTEVERLKLCLKKIFGDYLEFAVNTSNISKYPVMFRIQGIEREIPDENSYSGDKSRYRNTSKHQITYRRAGINQNVYIYSVKVNYVDYANSTDVILNYITDKKETLHISIDQYKENLRL